MSIRTFLNWCLIFLFSLSQISHAQEMECCGADNEDYFYYSEGASQRYCQGKWLMILGGVAMIGAITYALMGSHGCHSSSSCYSSSYWSSSGWCYSGSSWDSSYWSGSSYWESSDYSKSHHTRTLALQEKNEDPGLIFNFHFELATPVAVEVTPFVETPEGEIFLGHSSVIQSNDRTSVDLESMFVTCAIAGDYHLGVQIKQVSAALESSNAIASLVIDVETDQNEPVTTLYCSLPLSFSATEWTATEIDSIFKR